MARGGTSCFRGSNRLARLTCRTCYGVNIGSQSRASGGYEKAEHYRDEAMFHGFSPKAFDRPRAGAPDELRPKRFWKPIHPADREPAISARLCPLPPVAGLILWQKSHAARICRASTCASLLSREAGRTINSRAKGAPSSRTSARCLTGGGLFCQNRTSRDVRGGLPAPIMTPKPPMMTTAAK